MKLQVIIEKDETGYYVAEVPALPGCVSQGHSIAEAKTNIKEAIVGWLKVMNDKAKKHRTHIQNPEYSLAQLLKNISKTNLHVETDFGQAVGKEIQFF